MASRSRSSAVARERVGAIFHARWYGIWIQNTNRLSGCRFRLVWEKSGKYYEKDLRIGDNNLFDDWLYQGNKLTIEISNRRSSKFYIRTLPGSLKDSNYAYEDLSIAFQTDVVSQTPYGYFYICPWTLQGSDRWLKIYERNLVLRLDTPNSDRGIDIDWNYPFKKWLGGKFNSVPRSIEEPGYGESSSRSGGRGRLNAFTATLSTVKAYDWPEGFTVWLKTPRTDEERINGEKEVDIALSEKPKLVIKKNGRPVAVIYTQDEGSWDLGVCWNVDHSRAGNVKHVYRPPFDDEGDKHDLYVSPSWVTLYNYPHTYPRLGSNRGIAADISKDIGIWMDEDESLSSDDSD